MEENKIRSRSQIPVEDTWALEDLYPSDEAWERELGSLSEDQAFLASFAGRLGQSGQTLCAFLERMEQVSAKEELLGNYCMRKADQDTRNATYQAMSGRFMSAAVALDAACSFETPEIMAISDEQMETFYASEAGALQPVSDRFAPPESARADSGRGAAAGRRRRDGQRPG